MTYVAFKKTTDTTTASNLVNQTLKLGISNRNQLGVAQTAPTPSSRGAFAAAGTTWGSAAGTGTSGAIPVTSPNVTVFITVTNVTSSAVATVTVQWSNDGTNWSTSGDSYTTTLSANGTTSQTFTSKGAYCRLSWSIGTWSSGKTVVLTATAFQAN